MTTILLLVLGASGQLAQAVLARAGDAGFAIIARTRGELDICDFKAVRVAIQSGRADIVVNAAAYSKVDLAETEVEQAFRGNAAGPAVVARVCADLEAPLFHISTDYVFDGTGERAYREDDPIAPINTYGISKSCGEIAVRSLCLLHVIIRTSWVYGPYGANFLKTMVRLAQERDEIRVVADQRGCPTSTSELAKAILEIAARIGQNGSVEWGTFHFAGDVVTTWHGFAQEILSALVHFVQHRCRVIPISSMEYPIAARRPANSELDCGRFAACFGSRARPRQQSVREVVGGLYGERRV